MVPEPHGQVADVLSLPDSCELVPATGPQSSEIACSFLWQRIIRQLHPPVACQEWLVELPAASQLIHRVEQLPNSASLNLLRMHPLEPSLPVLLSNSPSVSYVGSAQYASLMEQYNTAAKDKPSKRVVLVLLLSAFMLSGMVLVGALPSMFRCLSLQWVLGVALPVDLVCLVASVVMVGRYMRRVWQSTVRRVLAVVRAANIDLEARYEEAVRSSSAGGAGPRRCVWRWLTTRKPGDAGTSYTLGLVLAKQSSGQQGETL